MAPPAFSPTPEQRRTVEILASISTRQDEICRVIFWGDKSISEKTLKRKFKRELETASTLVKEQVGALFLSAILGKEAPPGTTPITREEARAHMLEFFMKARAGWSDRIAVEGGDERRPIYIKQYRGDEGL